MLFKVRVIASARDLVETGIPYKRGDVIEVETNGTGIHDVIDRCTQKRDGTWIKIPASFTELWSPVKTYKYAIFLRCPNTGEVQHGTFETDTDKMLSFDELLDRIKQQKGELDFKFNYTLIGIQVISVEEKQE